MPLANEGNGGTSTNKKLSELCPTLRAGDVVYLKAKRNLNAGNTLIFLLEANVFFYANETSFTLTQEMLDSEMWLYGNNYREGETEQCILTDFRITKNADDEWEQFGASPSLEFPSSIRSVADNVNLLDIKTNWENNGSILYQADLKQNETYTIKIHNPDKSKNYAIKHSQYKDGYNNFTVFLNSSNDFCAITTSFSINEMNVGQKNGIVIWDENTLTELTTEEVKKLNIKIQKGSKATHYSEYGKGTIEIRQATKNLANSNGLAKQMINEVTFTPVYDKNGLLQYVNVNGTATALTNYKLPDVTYEPGNYYIQKNNSDESVTMLLVDIKSGSAISPTAETSSNFSITEETTCQYWIRVYEGVTVTNQKIYPQVRLASIADDSYEPYNFTTHILQTEPLRSLPNGVKDTIEADGIHRRVGKVVLDGSRYWYVNNTAVAGYDTWHVINTDISKNMLSNSEVLSDNFLGDLNWEKASSTQREQLSAAPEVLTLRLNKNRGVPHTAEGIKEYLSNHNTELHYPLVKEVIEPFELPKMLGNKGTTDITTTNEIKPVLDITYYKDLSTQNERLEDRLTAIEEMLSTTQTSAMLLDNLENDLIEEV